MSYSSKLYRLQQIDTQLDQTKIRLEQIDQILKENIVLQQAEDALNMANETLDLEKKNLHRAEEAVQSQHIKIQETEAALYGGKIRNPKELQDLQSEAAALKRHLVILEDRQIEFMVAVEEAEAKVKGTTLQYNQVQSKLESEQSLLRGERTNRIHDIERLDVEHNAAQYTISAEDLVLYEQLRRQRRGLAVVKVSDRSCSACGAMLTPAVIQTANSPTQLVRCGSCGRILFAN